jgi:hypothetical protein
MLSDGVMLSDSVLNQWTPASAAAALALSIRTNGDGSLVLSATPDLLLEGW